MNIIISAPLKRNEIVSLLTSYTENNISFKLVKSTGLKLEFEVEGIDGEAALSLAKDMIKATDFGKVLYFTVDEV